MTVFSESSPFITTDNRTLRDGARITAVSQELRHVALLPEFLVRGKSVLDLGCCVGATGHWCLEMGASSYVGVDSQEEYCSLARRNLSGRGEVVHSEITSFLATSGEFDVVVMMGVLYVFVDTYGILLAATNACRETLAVETAYPRAMVEGRSDDLGFLEINSRQEINLGSENSSLVGMGVRPSPIALALLLNSMSFAMSGAPSVPRFEDPSGTWYREGSLPDRYLRNFTRSGRREIPLLEKLVSGSGERRTWRK